MAATLHCFTIALYYSSIPLPGDYGRSAIKRSGPAGSSTFSMCHASRPLLSIIIPTLDEAECLPALLEDITMQRGITCEIFVGDGGSTDATGLIATAHGATFVACRRGRGAQMNAAAARSSGEYLLFLHADSRIGDSALLSTAVAAIQSGSYVQERVAGHFSLQFIRSVNGNTFAYRYAEEKTSLNRPDTTNGDQGLLLSRGFFEYLGGFDERMPFLEDQRIVRLIRAEGKLITLPGRLMTSARRFETEGFHRRYILMSMMMGLFSIGEEEFFARAPGVYRVQQETGALLLTPFFRLIRCMMRDTWGFFGTLRTFYRLGTYIRQNSWQLFFFLDVLVRPLIGSGRYPILRFYDLVMAHCLNFALFNTVAGIFCYIWFMLILSPYFRLIELSGLTSPSPQELSVKP
ncbi:MAG: glycosyltransferase [Desulfuromonadaceae bacterium]|nr:glycosyltransferase [Desulfuromonadaceae bacterium]MDD5105116.1 glycosyltransferase [Desulfuromonadaceae bacterium]